MMRFLSAVFMLLSLISLPVPAIENIGVKALEKAVAASTVLTDSDAFTFGIANFELKFLGDPDWGTEKTLDFKKNIDILVVPYKWHLTNINKKWSHSINMRVSYIEVQRNSEPLKGYTNFKDEQLFGGFIQYSQRYQLTENWYTGVSIGTHLDYYRNKYNYSEEFPDDLRDVLDGSIFNTSALILMSEPVLHLGYQKKQPWGQWTVHNSNHYLIGQGIGGSSKSISEVKPEGWRVTNGIEFKYNVPQIWGVTDHIAFDFKRIDIGGDMSGLSNNDHYYETSVGWVIDTKNNVPLLDNVGIGFSINYGSSISGGTLVFYYNE